MTSVVVRVRAARREDLGSIEALEAAAFARSTVAKGLDRDGAPTSPRCWVAVVDGQVRAFLSAAVVAGEIEIHDVAVDPGWRRRGVARELVRQVLREAADSGCGRAVLEVGERNLAARFLYERCGFRPCGRRKGYYGAGTEDARILEKTLP